MNPLIIKLKEILSSKNINLSYFIKTTLNIKISEFKNLINNDFATLNEKDEQIRDKIILYIKTFESMASNFYLDGVNSLDKSSS